MVTFLLSLDTLISSYSYSTMILTFWMMGRLMMDSHYTFTYSSTRVFDCVLRVLLRWLYCLKFLKIITRMFFTRNNNEYFKICTNRYFKLWNCIFCVAQHFKMTKFLNKSSFFTFSQFSRLLRHLKCSLFETIWKVIKQNKNRQYVSEYGRPDTMN